MEKLMRVEIGNTSGTLHMETTIIDLSPNGAITGGERVQTHEVRDIGGTASSSPSPPPVSMSFKDKVLADFGTAEDIMVIGDEDYTIQNGKLLRRWKLKEPITLIDLENNFLIVKFLLDEDMKYVLTGGPWQVVGQYVTTQRWKPGFNPKEEKITHMTTWVRINGLNVEFLGTASPPSSPPPVSMSFKYKVSTDFGMAEDIMAIIIKLMGRPLTYNFLREQLLRRWKLKEPITLIDLENNFLIVKFLLDEDMKYVLTGGLWQVVGQYATTQRWKPGFNPKEEKITHMTTWVRINGLNVEFFKFDVLEKISNLIGLTVKVDSHTISQSRRKFAQICVELNISKPLTPFIEVEGRTHGEVYE
ncbi:hypothetical protein DKX38_018464 [Salix brachista]|uniref:DUF4283 domain-containing protein n=1 Tax=Salix brachista TaxID=2182728 RepID=A0A5N5KN26_9ROSI|nr:hypothetical protein DKX38_018464 [Salix brachista]